jgi:hypothetical protein
LASKIEQGLPDEGSSPSVNAPCWLRDNQQSGTSVNLSAYNKFLQVAARQATSIGVWSALSHIKSFGNTYAQFSGMGAFQEQAILEWFIRAMTG